MFIATTVSSPPPIAPSTPKLVKVIPERSSSDESIASFRRILIESKLTLKSSSPGMVFTIDGGMVSLLSITSKFSSVDRELLPPVSVALTWTVVVPISSARTEKSKGAETSELTTVPFTSNSRFWTCTSSITVLKIGILLPARIWVPSVSRSVSAILLLIEISGACPWLSNAK